MKIDESCINHNVVGIISDAVDVPERYSSEDDNSDHIRLITLGYIRGVIDLANVLKEVLKT